MQTPDTTTAPRLAMTILDGVTELCEQAEKSQQPLEVDPLRGHLFEYFVTAEAGGYLSESADFDLTADNLCRILGERWGVTEAARESTAKQEKMNEQSLAKMRLLWSLMRMWMEWTYAWSRWDEFHSARTGESDGSPD